MTTTQAKNLWSAYVVHLAEDRTQGRVAEMVGGTTNQTTVGRWLSGAKVPTDAATAAQFARAFGRNPLEAFVAAGMLEESEAGRGLSDESRRLLSGLKARVTA